jgi:hypothetical protein
MLVRPANDTTASPKVRPVASICAVPDGLNLAIKRLPHRYAQRASHEGPSLRRLPAWRTFGKNWCLGVCMEAYDERGDFRASIYLRPLAIWAIEEALARPLAPQRLMATAAAARSSP